MYSKETGARVVAGCVVLNEDCSKVLMVGANRSRKWILPKGGAELDEEEDLSLAAVRETWEEGGAKGRIVKYLGKIPHDKRNRYPIKSEFHFYEMQDVTLEDSWPESDIRKRKWATFDEALHNLKILQRYELIQALVRSSIKKNEETPLSTENSQKDSLAA